MALVLVETGDVAVVTLNRPEALNALDAGLLEELEGVFKHLEARAVVVTGAGDAFCSGADLKERAELSDEGWRAHHAVLRRAFQALRESPAPTVAAVEGYAVAGGFELALACDLIVAASNAVLGLPEVTRGIMPGAGGTQVLPSRLAKDLVLTGRRLDVAEAQRHGLVARVVEPGQALEHALQLARQIAANAPMAVRAAKRAIDGRQPELGAYWAAVDTQDRREGIRAFLERRQPDFHDR
jgi:enoyl-CoA hydratase/carnithine racemase